MDEEKGIKNYDLQSLRKVRPGDIVQVHWDSKGRCDDMWIQHSLEDTDYYSPVLIDLIQLTVVSDVFMDSLYLFQNQCYCQRKAR